MRDIERIKPFCKELEELWSRYPDLRFGQIVDNLRLHLDECRTDIFYVEDDVLMERLRDMLG